MPSGFSVNPNAARALAEDDNSTIGNLLRFLSRPGYAFRSALSGDFDDTLENAAQFLLDLPTGGFLDRRLSLANILPDSVTGGRGDITTDDERPEFTDLVHRWGGAHPASRGFWGNLALDVVGGTLTDPLTLLTGPTKSVTGGALAGATRPVAQRKVADVLRAMAPDVLQQGADDALRTVAQGKRRGVFAPPDPTGMSPHRPRVFEPLGDDLVPVPRMQQTRLATLLESGDLSSLSPTRQRKIRAGAEGRFLEGKIGRKLGFTDEQVTLYRNKKALEDAATKPRPNTAPLDPAVPLPPGVLSVEQRLRNASEALQSSLSAEAELLDAGLAGMRADGLVGVGTGFRLKVPFGPVIAEAPNAWKHLGKYGTLPGLLKTGLAQHDNTKGLADLMDAGADKAWDFLKGVYDKTLTGKVAESMRYATQEANAFHIARNRRADRLTPEIFGRLDTEELQTGFGKIQARFEDEFAQKMWVSEAATPAELARFAPPDLKEMMGRFRKEITETLRDAEGRPLVSDRQIDQYLGEFKQMKKDLIRHDLWKDLTKNVPEGMHPDVWKEIASNPFYMSHQLNPLFNELLGEGLKNAKLKDAVADVFTKRRNYRTTEEFGAKLHQIAQEFGVRVDGMDDLQDFNVVRLFRNRMFAHNGTLMRAEIMDKAKRLGMLTGDAKDDVLAQYVKTQLTPTARDDMNPASLAAFSKILGGGKFRIDATGSPRLQEWAQRDPKKNLLARRLRTDRLSHKKIVEVDFPGLSYFWKPWLTSMVPAYHFRNTGSSIVMGGMDEDIGWVAGGKSVKALFHTTMNSPLVKRFADMGFKGDTIADSVQLLKQDPAVKAAAIARLEAAGTMFGRYTPTEFASILDAAIPERVNMNEIDQAIGQLDVFGRDIEMGWKEAFSGKSAPRLRAVITKVVKLGQDLANSTEQHFRAGAMIEMLNKGIDPIEAMQKLNRQFVNYNSQNLSERFARDVIPFLRFTIGSAPWVKTIANKPRLVGWMGRAQGSAENMNEDTGGIPTRAQGTLALPLPWKDEAGNTMFLTSLGLPQEVALNVLGLATPEGFRKGILGGLQPAIRLPLEASVGKTFFFGEEFGNFRKAPAWVPSFLTQKVTLPDGRVREEISGTANEILNALPSSRIDGMINRLVDSERPFWNKMLQTLTGARTITVDAEKELATQLSAYLKEKAKTGEVGETLIYFSRLEEEEMPEDLKAVLAEMSALKQRKRKRGLREVRQ